MRPRVERIAEELLAGMSEDTETDLLEAFAVPLPITVICELLGVPPADRMDFRGWSNTLLSSGGPDTVADAATAMAEYLAGLVAVKREAPGDDLLSGLVQVRDSSDRLDENELISMAFLLLVAGHETTVNLIGNGMLALLRDRHKLAALRADPALIPGAAFR